MKLLRAPSRCGSWSWWPDERVAGPVEQAETAARLAAVTARHGLLEASQVACRWEVDGRIVPRAWATVEVAGTIDPADLVSRLASARPQELPETAQIGEFVVTGSGIWLDESGTAHTEQGMLQLIVETATDAPNVAAEVFHDVWMSHDFHGDPHPEIHARNAPRLAEALAEIGAVLRAEAEPGDSTSFGHPVGLGVANSADADDIPLDVMGLMDL